MTPFAPHPLLFFHPAWTVNMAEFPAGLRLALSVPLLELEKDFHCEQSIRKQLLWAEACLWCSAWLGKRSTGWVSVPIQSLGWEL